MKTYKISNIQWDCDDDIIKLLPKKLEIQCHGDINPKIEIADLLADQVGYCVLGCSYTEI